MGQIQSAIFRCARTSSSPVPGPYQSTRLSRYDAVSSVTQAIRAEGPPQLAVFLLSVRSSNPVHALGIKN